MAGPEFVTDRDLVQRAQAPPAVALGNVEADPAAGVQLPVPPVQEDRQWLVRPALGKRVFVQPGTEVPAQPVQVGGVTEVQGVSVIA